METVSANASIGIDKFNKYMMDLNDPLQEKQSEAAAALEPYKVDNAIFLAAGIASRCKPLSDYIPKGLVKVRGEILIERQIHQLREAGIDEIIIVVGYMAEKFQYLEKKLGVKLIYNEEFDGTNNISSVWAAKEHLANSYILGSDNWYARNIFSNYVYKSYFSKLYSSEYVDEYCIETKDGIITSINRGGENTWYTLGEIFLDRNTSQQIVSDLSKEYGSDPDVRNMIIDDYCKRHIAEYEFMAIPREEDLIFEFDTLDELEEFDPDFEKYASLIMSADNQ